MTITHALIVTYATAAVVVPVIMCRIFHVAKQADEGMCFSHFWRNPCPYCARRSSQKPLILRTSQIVGEGL